MNKSARCSDCPQFSTGIFASLSEKERKERLCIFNSSLYNKRQSVFEQGQSADLVFLVRSGLVKVYKKGGSTRRQILSIAGPGEILGIEAIFRTTYCSSAEAITRSEICYCQGRQFSHLLEEHPRVSLRVIDMMHQDIMKTHTFLCDMGTKKAYARLASCLLFFRGKYGTDESLTFQLPIKRSEMSRLLGLSPETISRQLRKLTSDGIIKLENKRVAIKDLARLSEAAQQD